MSKISKEDQLHKDIRIWLDENEYPPMSLDEIPLELFTPKHLIERNEFIKRFDNL